MKSNKNSFPVAGEMQGKREETIKNLAYGEIALYRKTAGQLEFANFYLPFSGKLRSDNRWVRMAKIVPWAKFEARYAENFAVSGMGAQAKPIRMALGALIIKAYCSCTDEETVEQIRENPYLQHFIGLTEFQNEPPFDPSMMVHFRKRFDMDILNEINESVCQIEKKEQKDINNNDIEADSDKNEGTLILDATCAPSDIRYPTDLGLLNEAREKLEAVIDELHQPGKGETVKPRTYRRIARRDYLRAVKVKKPHKKMLYKSIGKQLRYLARDLKIIEQLQDNETSKPLNERQTKNLLTIKKLYQQQKQMHEKKEHHIEDRIVSISQPHVRPIVRGKAGAQTEFGAKVAISVCNGFALVEKLGWNNFNEGIHLIEHVETYKQRHGYYPKAVVADKIYRNRANITFCNKHGIRLSGPRLGRPKLDLEKEQKRIERMDNRTRNAVEGKFGEGKRRYGLARIMAKLQATSESVIVLQFLVMNLEHRLRLLFIRFWLTVCRMIFAPDRPDLLKAEAAGAIPEPCLRSVWRINEIRVFQQALIPSAS
jgi:hypothetical protein